MAIFAIKIPWTSKPPPGTPIDWSNPLTKGLMGCWPMNEAGGKKLTDITGNFPIATGDNFALWREYFYLGNSVSGFPRITSKHIGQRLTVITRVYAYISTSAWDIYFNQFQSAWNSAAGFSLAAYNNQLWFLVGTATTPYYKSVISSVNTNNAAWNDFAGMYDGNNVSCISNGVLTQTAYSGAINESVLDFRLGCAGDNSLPYANGGYQYLYLYKYGMSPADVKKIHANPWQIFQPRIVYADLPISLGHPAIKRFGAVPLVGLQQGVW